MNYRKLKKNYHAVLTDREITIFDTKSNQFYFFDEIQSNNILEIINGKKDFFQNNCEMNLFEKSYEKYQIPIFNNIEGIDNYSWANARHFLVHEDTFISLSDKFQIIIIYFFILIGKDFFIHEKLNLIKKLKKNKKNLSLNIAYSRSAGNFIHKISNKLPFNLKCFEYSLILSIFLLLNNYDCKFKIGIQKYDFLSHAWIEVSNQPIADMPDLSKRLAIIFEI